MKNGTILNNQLKCCFSPDSSLVTSFFFFLREVISSLLVALKYSFLWEKSQCILLLIACVTQFVFSNSSKNSTEKEKY